MILSVFHFISESKEFTIKFIVARDLSIRILEITERVTSRVDRFYREKIQWGKQKLVGSRIKIQQEVKRAQMH